MAEFQNNSSAAINNSIVIKNYTFIFLNKFVYIDKLYVTLISRENGSGDERKLIFTRSKSECGMWRLCISNPADTGLGFYLQKGRNYSMSTFIILELQFFLNSILDRLEDVTDSEHTPYRICQSHYGNRGETIDSLYRSINVGEFNESNDIVKKETIQKINDYNYDSNYENFNPVSQLDQWKYNSLNTEEKKNLWPQDKNEKIVGMDRAINFGDTNIKVNGSIYSVTMQKYGILITFYYMIYSCNITLPEDIAQYNSTQNPDYQFKKKIEGINFIIPIYAIPQVEPTTHVMDITGYGLYNFFCAFRYNNKDLSFSKILEYIQQCKNYNSNEAPTCTTEYKFMGNVYNEIDILSDLKDMTLHTEITEQSAGKKSRKRKRDPKNNKKLQKTRKKRKIQRKIKRRKIKN